MNCEFAEEQILAALDGPLSKADVSALEAHLASCESCAKFGEMQLAIDAGLTAHFASVVADDFLAARIADHVKEAEPASIPAWVPDALNAAGIAAMMALLALLGLQGIAGTVALFWLLALVGYPLVSAWAE